jgi:hypothetical protein
LAVQTYANSVLSQPQVDFSTDPQLSSYQTQINNGLTTAQGHANYYLNTLQPSLIQNLANIQNYYILNQVLPTTLPVGSTNAQWVAELTAVQTQSSTYKTAAQSIVSNIQAFHSEISTDAQSFNTTVTELNTVVGGDNGVLSSINGELSSLQKQIDGAIAGIVISALTIVGGVFVICVGAVADFVTAGTSTGAVIGGVGIVAAGVAGEAGSITALVSLNNQKASLLREETQLTDEVKLATAVGNGYTSLVNQVNNALTAASSMANAWESLVSDIGSLISDLNSGITSADAVRQLFLAAANGEIQNVLTDLQTIKTQMAGVTVNQATSGQTVSDVIAKTAAAASKAA